MPDKLFTAADPDAGIAICTGVTTDLVREAQRLHHLTPTATAAVGRLLTATALLGTALKGKERISLQITGDGPLGSAIAEAWLVDERTVGARGRARNPHIDIPLNPSGKFDVAGAVGTGQLQVTKSFPVGQPYVGAVPLRSGEIAEDVAAYLAHSEQIPSVVALGVLADPQGVRAAGGAIAQVLAGADERAIAILEERAGALRPITTLVAEGHDAATLLDDVAGTIALRSRRSYDVLFACLCTREKVEAALMSLGNDELAEMALEPLTEATCEYCRREYTFSNAEIRGIMERASAG